VRFDTPGPLALRLWSRLSPLPGGPRLFSRLLGLMIPYTGSVRARVVSLAPGEAEVALRDRRRVRNHLASVHAVALVNLGELASGLAITTALPPGVRGIPIRIDTEYLAKARGELRASARFVPPPIDGDTDVTLQVPIRNSEGETVARVTATWRLRDPGTSGKESRSGAQAGEEAVARP